MPPSSADSRRSKSSSPIRKTTISVPVPERTLVRRAAVKRAAALFVNSDVMAINTELMIAVRYGYSA